MSNLFSVPQQDKALPSQANASDERKTSKQAEATGQSVEDVETDWDENKINSGTSWTLQRRKMLEMALSLSQEKNTQVASACLESLGT